MSQSKKKFYAVLRGDIPKPKIYTSWKACQKVVIGVKGAKYQGFETEAEAEYYIKNNGRAFHPSRAIDAKESIPEPQQNQQLQFNRNSPFKLSELHKNDLPSTNTPKQKKVALERRICPLCGVFYTEYDLVCGKCKEAIYSSNLRLDLLFLIKKKYLAKDVIELIKQKPIIYKTYVDATKKPFNFEDE